MSNLRNDHVALSILGVKGHRYGTLRVLVGSRVENTTQLSIGREVSKLYPEIGHFSCDKCPRHLHSKYFTEK